MERENNREVPQEVLAHWRFRIVGVNDVTVCVVMTDQMQDCPDEEAVFARDGITAFGRGIELETGMAGDWTIERNPDNQQLENVLQLDPPEPLTDETIQEARDYADQLHEGLGWDEEGFSF